jgi:hypothetical protein
MEGIIVTVGLYVCFALIVVGAFLAFPAAPRVVRRHWSGVHPGDTLSLHGEQRRVVEVDLDHDAVTVDRPFDFPIAPDDHVLVRHDELGRGRPAPVR